MIVYDKKKVVKYTVIGTTKVPDLNTLKLSTQCMYWEKSHMTSKALDTIRVFMY